MTSGKEDYLKALYALGYDGHTVSNKEIADMLRVSPPSVSEMIVKLQKEGYIDYTAYKGSRLTEKGASPRPACSATTACGKSSSCAVSDSAGAKPTPKRTPWNTTSRKSGECPRRFPRLSRLLPPRHAHSPPGRHPRSRLREDAPLPRAGQFRLHLPLRRRHRPDGLPSGFGHPHGHGHRHERKAPYEGPVIFLSDGKEYTLSYKAASQVYIR